jgi:hypothetical protein
MALQTLVYPNPSNGVFTVSVPAGKTFELTITDLTGKVVKRQTTEAELTQVQLQNIAKGVYLLQIVSEGKTAMHKLVIE